MALSNDQLKVFASQGYLVIPGVVAADKIDVANKRVDELMRDNPPSKDHTGFYFYNLNDVDTSEALIGVLNQGAARDLVADLVAPNKVLTPQALQVSLIIPPYDHRPGAGHIDLSLSPGPQYGM